MFCQRIQLEHCNLDYYRHFLEDSLADDLFEIFLETLDWQQENIMIFGKQIPSPRLQCFYGEPNVSYRYSGRTFHAKKWGKELSWLNAKVSQFCNIPFNGVLCNLYRDGCDAMGWHSDNEKELGENPIITSVSFGQPRMFAVRKNTETKQMFSLPLAHNSALVMNEGCQSHLQHSIPKSKKPLKARINLTFRHFQ
ncbi:alpha-ketoglutarate-dependent dioxygenase AlkB family protein [Litoribacillus peritrichatus]|uniref:Alpha-ketoglutarate-dependent dioxygenase AlkB n=1 Tax=Litoribacillus peritrichatus TaxID=718191 RepID=A0ABP7M210_9GAMM